MLAGLPAMSMAAIEIIDQDAQATVISQTTNNTLHIVNANGDVVYIYNVAGKPANIASERVILRKNFFIRAYIWCKFKYFT